MKNNKPLFISDLCSLNPLCPFLSTGFSNCIKYRTNLFCEESNGEYYRCDKCIRLNRNKEVK